jgi:hypothetical protein
MSCGGPQANRRELTRYYFANLNFTKPGRVKDIATRHWTLQPIMDYQMDTQAEYLSVMDLFASEQLNGRLLIKIGALACFVLASALLAASLFVPPPAQVGMENGAPGAFTGAIR